MSPSRFSLMRLLGMMGKRLKCSKWAKEINLYRLRRPVWFLASTIRWLGCGAAAPAAPGAQGAHGRVDLLKGFHPHVPQVLIEGHQHIGHGGGIIGGPVVVEGGRSRYSAMTSSLYLPSLGSRFWTEDQGVQAGIVEGACPCCGSPRPESPYRTRRYGRPEAGPPTQSRKRLSPSSCPGASDTMSSVMPVSSTISREWACPGSGRQNSCR